MNAQDAREYMPLVQALANGLTIQFNDGGDWVDVENLNTDSYDPDEYRLKPKPIMFDIWINKKTNKVIAVEDGDHDKDDSFFEWERITVMEVLK